MINLSKLKLSDLLPSSIKDNKEVSAMAAAIDNELQAITACINEIILLPRISELPEDIIDSLAWQLHVDFYEPLGLDLDKKRALVENSLNWHRRKGTKSVLAEMIRILFFDDFRIEEWYEYEGEPYFFKLIVNGFLDSQDKYDSLIRAVYELKNVRSWLERIVFKQEARAIIYTGTAVKHIRKSIVAASDIGYQDISLALRIGTAVKHVRRTTIMNVDLIYQPASLDLRECVAVKHVRRTTVQCSTGGDIN